MNLDYALVAAPSARPHDCRDQAGGARPTPRPA